MFKIFHCLFISLIMICLYQYAEADCCHASLIAEYRCVDEEGNTDGTCEYVLCNDGTESTPYCGYGTCNIFGCNCDGGCRMGTLNKAKEKFLEAHPNIELIRII